ncbi:MAG: D-alanyl-D-alanine carboxypeptidase, partial [Petrimonas sp.]|nr:D-alanyl-D-alanine carboxypeptidase [Petrimonas sp.]
MKRFLLLYLSLCSVWLSYSQVGLQQLLNNSALKHASVGIQVTDLNTGKTIVSHDPQKSLTPASVTKVITSAT